MVAALIVVWCVAWIFLGVMLWTRYLDLTAKDFVFTCIVAPIMGPGFLLLTWLYFAPDLSDGKVIIRKRKK